LSVQVRRWPLGRLLVAALIAVVFAVLATGLTSGLIVGTGPRGEGCRLFLGEAVDGVAWSTGGDLLVVRTRTAEGLDDGYTGLRVFRWPGMDLVSQIRGTWYVAGESIAVPPSLSPGPIVSSRGILAGPSAQDHWRSNQLCVLDEGGSSSEAEP
jgi:hypothetical protein